MGSIPDPKALDRLAAAIEQLAKERGFSYGVTDDGAHRVHLGNEVHVVVRDSGSLLVPSITAIRRCLDETLAEQQFLVTIVAEVNTWSSAASASSGLGFADGELARILLDENVW